MESSCINCPTTSRCVFGPPFIRRPRCGTTMRRRGPPPAESARRIAGTHPAVPSSVSRHLPGASRESTASRSDERYLGHVVSPDERGEWGRDELRDHVLDATSQPRWCPTPPPGTRTRPSPRPSRGRLRFRDRPVDEDSRPGGPVTMGTTPHPPRCSCQVWRPPETVFAERSAGFASAPIASRLPRAAGTRRQCSGCLAPAAHRTAPRSGDTGGAALDARRAERGFRGSCRVSSPGAPSGRPRRTRSAARAARAARSAERPRR